ncbi:SDR family NAD(P)-dependent oxidoreductase [Acinetobacter baumannii]
MPSIRQNKKVHCAVVIGVDDVQGIGAAVCRRFAQEGLFIYVVGRTESKLQAIVDVIRSSVAMQLFTN